MNSLYLSLGSNIEPEVNLPKAVQMLREVGKVEAISSVWETESVGFDGPNFLNACVIFLSPLEPVEFKEKIIRPIEARLERVRSSEKNAPRTIDIDIVLCGSQPLNTDFWEYAFVVVPLAELIPDFAHPARGEAIARVAAQVRGQVWMRKRGDVSLQ
ncbi:MAG: 2-amino-4-hydroxy-6-hydroxymethyldihydropteridine diphosphokinase [Chloroflexi bacterium]|nr:2-amino-4-hydroxy-6-hydroxymethyldihydropteridine diphosphokinase [Chloroflexota bacterium]MDL1943914.1 2-amino-4-hydroxy-6-hydroxymethyldihydropteridine diphosphokinase [Chloroflexi bacterium CFX2]